MFQDLADAGSLPLKVVWLKIYKFRFYINLATFSPGRCNESRVSNSQITTVNMESLRTCNQLLITLEGVVGPLMENLDI